MASEPDWAAIARELGDEQHGPPHEPDALYEWFWRKSTYTYHLLKPEFLRRGMSLFAIHHELPDAISEAAEMAARMHELWKYKNAHPYRVLHVTSLLSDHEKEGAQCAYCPAEHHGGKWL